MANANNPRGLVPYRRYDGSVWNGSANIYYVASGTATNIFPGDPLIPSGTSDANGIPGVILATGGDSNYTLGPMVGIVNGGQPIITVLQNSPVYHPASTGQYILVADDPNLLFWAQEDSVGGSMSPNDSMSGVNLVSGTGNTYYGTSGWMLDSSTVGTANKQCRLMRPLNEVDNVSDGTDSYTKWLVKINLHSVLNPAGI